ncbi:hypothetical protein DNJ72_00215 [Prochlorococcus marinus XMU1403]|uniref:hypothetical protein n=1 Tax=Prochlorococcus marinus TaxID=1219 RepID=UPI000D930DB9|nr:hypothetical protein [Prochlorococcus marinus]PYE03935.1 hypothetical protein DNJ72_00215 [Prochlorococcus marinus XMU1403]
MDDNWDFLLSEFRRLGGIADNVFQKEGKYGRGIFSVDPSKRARIFTPKKLMVKKDDIFLEDNKLRIKKDKEYHQEIRDFFYFYQDNFSWGFGGQETTELLEKGLSLFNSNLKELIKKYALVNLEERHKGKWSNVIQKQFLNARAFNFKNNSFIVPLVELVNHKVRSLPYITNKDGISTPNYPPSNSEIRHSYNNMSPLYRFFSYGFYSEETIIFSIPFSIMIEDINIFCKGMSLHNDSMQIERSGNKIILEGLPIVDVNHPRLPYDYFDEIIRKIANRNIRQDLLLKIIKNNISIRKKILEQSQLIENEVSNTLTKLMHYEINLISSHN